MNKIVITTRPADEAAPQGEWMLCLNGCNFQTHPNCAVAERHADNLREVLMSSGPAARRINAIEWFSASLVVLAVALAVAVVAITVF